MKRTRLKIDAEGRAIYEEYEAEVVDIPEEVDELEELKQQLLELTQKINELKEGN